MEMKRLLAGALGVASAIAGSAGASTFDIVLSFSGTPTASQQSTFTAAEAFWESQVTGYQPGVASGLTLNINAEIAFIDGAGGILGSAGPSVITNTGGFVLPTTGNMSFDSADVGSLESAGTFDDVILHEMAHVMGFGTLWTDNGLYTNGTGQYAGANGLAAYTAEFDSAATFVPVELGGGAGTANGHWDEAWAGGGNALMTGWLDTPTFVSRTTVESFADLGYTVAAVPLPAGGLLLLSGLGALGLFGRRRRA